MHAGARLRTALRMALSARAATAAGCAGGAGLRRPPGRQLAILDQVGIERQVAPDRARSRRADERPRRPPPTRFRRRCPWSTAGSAWAAPARSRPRATRGSAAPGRPCRAPAPRRRLLARSTMRSSSGVAGVGPRPLARRMRSGGRRRRDGCRCGAWRNRGLDRGDLRHRRRTRDGCGSAGRRRGRPEAARNFRTEAAAAPVRASGARRAGTGGTDLGRQPALARKDGTSRHKRQSPAPPPAGRRPRPARRVRGPARGNSIRSGDSPGAASALKRRTISRDRDRAKQRRCAGSRARKRCRAAQRCGLPPAPPDEQGECAARPRCRAAPSPAARRAVRRSAPTRRGSPFPVRLRARIARLSASPRPMILLHDPEGAGAVELPRQPRVSSTPCLLGRY